ncbi:MAG: 50S ribosomal protein L16 [Bacteroidia bacterium]|nr:50S ribosomal protein L16 [Bacteroidia bacterium]
MLQPRKVKWRKPHKGSTDGNSTRGTDVSFGSYGLKALEPAYITARQIEACRITISRTMKREGSMWIRVFPDKSLTRKPAEVRMGKGKGNPEFWAALVRPGKVLFELDGVPESVALEAMRLAANKLPIKTKIVTRRDLQTQ